MLLRLGAPIEGIGIQGHFQEDLTPIPRLLTILDRFAVFGLPIQITEPDFTTWDEPLQADYTRDFLTAMFSHPSVTDFLVRGFWEKAHWIPGAAYYRADRSPRPAGEVRRDLVFRQWWTKDLTIRSVAVVEKTAAAVRVRLDFPTIPFGRYAIQYRQNFEDDPVGVPFATAPTEPATLSDIETNGQLQTVYVDAALPRGFFSVALVVEEI